MEYADFVLKYWYLFAALVVVLALLVFGPLYETLHGITRVDVWKAVQLMNHESAVVIDVGDPQEFKAGHIPNALNIPLAVLGDRAKELEKHKSKPILLSCRTGNRSGRGAAILRKRGFQKIYTLAGGLASWERDNLPVQR